MSQVNLKIAIASGKGGTGKTLISTNLFYSIQQYKHPITLVDCDAEEPNVLGFFKGKINKTLEVTQKVPEIDAQTCTFCGKCYEYCNYNAIFILPEIKVIRVIEDLCHGCGTCPVACEYVAITEKVVSLGTVGCMNIEGNSRIIEARTKVGVYSPVTVIKAAINEAGTKGIILMDAPPGTSCAFIQTVAVADYVILVTEPTPFGLSDLKQSVETLHTIGKPCGVIVNRAGLGNDVVYQYLKQENISLLMKIPFDREIATIYSKGELVAKYRTDWMAELMNMFESINNQYGNSGYQR